MKKMILFLTFGLLLTNSALTVADCFLVKENNQIIKEEGDCKSRHAPCCSFNIAISLMGYNEGLLIDEANPVYPFKKGYVDYIESWKQPHNPTLWMKNSCLWYSRVLTPKIGIKKFKEYVTKFNYGNQDVSGDRGQINGLTHSWLSSSLEISPEEQTIFLQNLIDRNLPISSKALDMTKNIIFVEDLVNGWKLYGKTGFCSILNQDRTEKLKDRHNEWFVGWIEKGARTIVFTSYIEHTDSKYDPAGREAKVKAREKLLQLIQNNDKN